ncbi:MAG: TrmH family RNA methyltransferase [Fusobacteriaceae bacterium]
MKKIISSENIFYKKIKKLKHKKFRQEELLYIAEGKKFLGYNNISPLYIILRENLDLNYSDTQKLLDKFSCDKFEFTEKLFDEISSQENSQGIILIYEIKNLKLSSINFESKNPVRKNCEQEAKESDSNNLDFDNNKCSGINSDLIILDKIQDPGNMGTIIRICDCAGFKNIVLTDGTVDPYSEKVVRSSMGSILHVNIFMSSASEIINFAREKNYKIFVTALDKKSVSYTNMKLSDKNIFVFGSEGAGVSDKFISVADEQIIIPIYGEAESLNVGVATGIILYKLKELVENV